MQLCTHIYTQIYMQMLIHTNVDGIQVKQRDSTHMLRGLVDTDVEHLLEKRLSGTLVAESARIQQMDLANQVCIHEWMSVDVCIHTR